MQLENVENFYPLSPLQEGMLFHSVFESDSGMYFNQSLMTLKGDLDVQAFRRAWQRVVERHAILRTFFVWEGVKKPIQVVQRKVDLPFAYYDLRGLSQGEQQKKLENIRQDDLREGFSLSKAPLMRVNLLQTADGSHEFLWSFHHILMDGWSMFRVLKEAFGLYEAFVKGQDLQLEHLRPFRDYVVWLKQQSLSRAEGFWRKTLKGFTAPTPLVVDSPNGAKIDTAEASEEDGFATTPLYLSEAATTALKSMSQKYHLTLNTLVQGAWALLLSRYSREQDVAFGAVVSGRPATLDGVESMVGLFINTLPVRVKMSPQDSLLDWLQQLQAHLVELREYEYSPLVEVHGWSEVPRGLPFFESFFLFENYRKDLPLEAMGESVAISNVRWFERTNYPLMVLAVPDKRLLLRIAYQCRRFDAATITRMLGHWRRLLEGMVANPHCRLSDLPLLTPVEKHQLLVELNDTKRDYPAAQCLHHLFEAQVERTPDAIAVVFEDQQLTYRKLNHRANQLAHRLQQMGVGPETLVGICMERSLEMMIALLGVLKAGGAYVPLDPAYPKDRIEYVLQDAGIKILLTSQFTIDNYELRMTNYESICLDTNWQEIEAESDSDPSVWVDPENLAYTIYTSGSTGRPKGVSIPHRALVNFLVSMQNAPGIAPPDALLAVTTLSFDIAGLELYLPLITGARVELASREETIDATQLIDRMQACGATIMQATPATWRMLIDAGWPRGIDTTQQGLPRGMDTIQRGWQGCADLKILCGGEALPKDLADKLKDLCAALWNVYGPTETTIWSTATRISGEDEAISIGRPIANTQIYITDARFRPVPIAVTGELYIGGDGVARGYFNRPDLTAEKFLPNPFFGVGRGEWGVESGELGVGSAECGVRNSHPLPPTPDPPPPTPHTRLSTPRGARLYNTGDLARYWSDGKIDFLGRNDFQVKIRGFRIELGEIEAVLAQHPAVRQVVVHVRQEQSGVQQMVAYVIAKNEAKPAIEILRSFLLEKLPEYMAPAAFVFLEAFPLTPNGKVDRKALPAPESSRQNMETTFVAPTTEIERQIAAIWRDALGTDQVGLNDNFFDLGGHSLLMTQVFSRLRGAFKKDLSMLELFRFPTVSAMAGYLSNGEQKQPAGNRGEDRAALRRAALQRRQRVS